MDLKTEICNLLFRYGIKPKKGLGQNFVTDSALLDRMISYANIGSNDVVLEIGAGMGFLTELLSKKAGKVIAVEKDPVLINVLRDRLGRKKNIVLVESDILKTEDLTFDKIVSNPPYQLSSPLIFKLLKYPFKIMILTLQKEFAERLTASEGTKEYGRLTVMVNLKAFSEIMEYIKPDAFFPIPKVESAVLRMIPRESSSGIKNEAFFTIFVRDLFTQRNKLSRRVVCQFIQKHFNLNEKDLNALINCLPSMNKRVFQLSPYEFIELSNLVWAARKNIAKSRI